MTEQMARIDPVKVEIGDDEKAAVAAVLSSGRLVQGEQVAAFEAEFAELVGGRTCVAVNSGTSALHLSLIAAGIGPGDEVIVPSFTFAASANAVVRAGATPVFADIEPDHFTLDPVAVEKTVTAATRAVMPVHLYGHPAACAELSAVCSDHNLLLLEDACQAHGAALDEIPVGALGPIAAFSFYATKNMTTGEGGMVVCEDEPVARTVRLLRNQGMEIRYRNEIAGLNNRMTDIAAAIGRVQLASLPSWNDRRREIAAAYDEGLAGLSGLTTPAVAPGARHVYHQYTIRVTRRDELQDGLEARGVGSAVYYPVPTHRLPAYSSAVDLPETDRAAAEVLSLPLRPGLTTDEVDRVVSAVREIVGGWDG
jgi:dTDP-4-amino-4,6-dideoxygalactose transaminase